MENPKRMVKVKKIFIHGMLLLMVLMGSIQSVAKPGMTSPPIQRVSLNVDLFLSSTCIHCKNADVFFQKLESVNPWLSVKRHYIDEDTAALQLFYQRLQEQNISNFSVPAMFFCGSYWTGFNDPSSTGKSLIKALDYCHQQVIQKGDLTPATIHVLQQWGMASQYQINPNEAPAPSILIPMLAFSDAFGSCSIFSFMVFIAFLWLYPKHRWMQFTLGVVLMGCLGVIHYLQQAEAAMYYYWLSKFKIATLVVGVLLLLSMVRDFQSTRRGPVLKPDGLVFFVGIVSVVAVQVWQQTCLVNINFVFEQWLNNQSLTTYQQIIYQLYYLVAYLLPLMLILLFYLFFGQSQRILAWQKILQTTAYVMLISVATLLIVYPACLGNLMISLLIFFISIGMGWFLTWLR